MRRLGVIVAMPQEAAAILEDSRFGWKEPNGDAWESSRYPLRLEVCGVGKVFASWACASLSSTCDLLLGLGTSGGLGSEVIGSLWIGTEFVEHDMEASGLWYEPGVTPFAGMEGPVVSTLSPATLATAHRAAAAEAGLGVGVGEARIASGDVFIADPLRARRLAERTGARLCDMESAAVAKLCKYRGLREAGEYRSIEFFSLRSVSDNADHQAARTWSEQVKDAARDLDAFLLAFVKLLQDPDGPR